MGQNLVAPRRLIKCSPPADRTELRVFEFRGGHTVRSIHYKDEWWFVAADVCRALDLSLGSGTHKWLGGLDGREKLTVTRVSGEHPRLFRVCQTHSLALITESGLYKLVLRSNRPEAREFQDWVTRVVLPSIRETGGYIVGQEKVGRAGEETEAEFMARAHLVAKGIMDRQAARIVALEGRRRPAGLAWSHWRLWPLKEVGECSRGL